MIQLRHIAGAHTVTLLTTDRKRKTSFTLSRPGLQDGEVVLYNEENKMVTWDIARAHAEYDTWIQGKLDLICQKAITAAFRSSQKHETRFNALLNVIRLRQAGDDVTADLDGNIIIHVKLAKQI